MSAVDSTPKVSFRIGDEMPSFTTPELTRSHFVRYAGASGDFNPMHHDDEFAQAKGSPSVFGQGMLAAGILGQAVARWVGPALVRRFGVRFSAQVWPRDVLTCAAKVVAVYADNGLARADLECWVRNQKGDTVLTGTATVGPHSV
jgi:acyl dehydratase